MRSLDLDKYVEDFRSFGFEYVGQLSGESEPSLRLICETFEMDAMETHRFMTAVANMPNFTVTSLPTVANLPSVPDMPDVPNVPNVPHVPVPLLRVAAAAPAVAANVSGHLLVGIKPVYKTLEEVRAVTLKHSSRQLCSCMRDNNLSGGRKVAFRCRTVLSKSKRGLGHTPCPYLVIWRKKRQENIWRLDLQASELKHVIHCTSGQNLRTVELVTDPEFAKNVRNGQKNTARYAGRHALGREGRVSGCVRAHVARRAKNAILNEGATFYEVDWCKLRGWKRDFETMNPGSKCEIEVDEHNR